MAASLLLFVMTGALLGGVLGQDDVFSEAYHPTTFNFDDLPVVEAPKPPFLGLGSSDVPQYQPSVGGQNFQLVTKVFTLPNGDVTTLQVPQPVGQQNF